MEPSLAVFHATAIGVAVTGVIMMFTGPDLGPYGPIMIALGIYALICAMMVELVYGLFRVARRLQGGRAVRAAIQAVVSQ